MKAHIIETTADIQLGVTQGVTTQLEIPSNTAVHPGDVLVLLGPPIPGGTGHHRWADAVITIADAQVASEPIAYALRSPEHSEWPRIPSEVGAAERRWRESQSNVR